MSVRYFAALLLIACEPTVVPGEFCADQHGNAVPKWTGYKCCEDGNGGQCPEELYCWGVDSCSGPLPPNYVNSKLPEKRRYR